MKKSTLVATLTVLALMLVAGPAFAGGVVSNNSKWQKDYPEQFASWKETSKSDKITDMLEEKPQLVILWAGYGFCQGLQRAARALLCPAEQPEHPTHRRTGR